MKSFNKYYKKNMHKDASHRKTKRSYYYDYNYYIFLFYNNEFQNGSTNRNIIWHILAYIVFIFKENIDLTDNKCYNNYDTFLRSHLNCNLKDAHNLNILKVLTNVLWLHNKYMPINTFTKLLRNCFTNITLNTNSLIFIIICKHK